jgi:membrane-associated phospholipid phosphatase
LKLLVDRPRPPYDPDALWSEPDSPSFPSGHVMSATVVYGWLLYLCLVGAWQRRWRIAGGAVAVIALTMTAVATVYLALHWPTDIIGGYLWGLVLILPAVWLKQSHFARTARLGRSGGGPGGDNE